MVGDKRNVIFWLDDWVGVGSLCELLPRIFRAVSIKESVVSDCYEMRDDSMVWDVSFRRRLHPSEEVQYGESLRLLANVFFCRNSKDSRN